MLWGVIFVQAQYNMTLTKKEAKGWVKGLSNKRIAYQGGA